MALIAFAVQRTARELLIKKGLPACLPACLSVSVFCFSPPRNRVHIYSCRRDVGGRRGWGAMGGEKLMKGKRPYGPLIAAKNASCRENTFRNGPGRKKISLPLFPPRPQAAALMDEALHGVTDIYAHAVGLLLASHLRRRPRRSAFFILCRAGHLRYFWISSIIENYFIAILIKLMTYFCTSPILRALKN